MNLMNWLNLNELRKLLKVRTHLKKINTGYDYHEFKHKVKFIVAFDVDGTLECGKPNGPIKLEILKKLKHEGLIVGIVGAYEKVKKELLNELDFYYGGDPNKLPNLRKIKENYCFSHSVYVADKLSDKLWAKLAGFEYIHPEEFSIEILLKRFKT